MYLRKKAAEMMAPRASPSMRMPKKKAKNTENMRETKTVIRITAKMARGIVNSLILE